MKYPQQVAKYFFHPCHIGEFDTRKTNVASARVSANSYGICIQLHLEIENNHIKNTAVKVKGCPYTIACACYIAENLINLLIDDAKQFNARDIAKALELPDAKFYTALLAEDSVKTAIRNYEQKTVEIK